MPSITQLEYILAVEEFGNFSKAAKSCKVSQPSLSIQVAKLEDELQVIVFDRTKKPLLVTEEGTFVLAQAKVVLNEYKKIFAVLEKKGELMGEFKLAVIPTLSPYLIPLFIKDLSLKFPKLKLKIQEMKTEDIIQALISDKLDAGLLVTPLHNDSLIEKVLFYEDFYLFASKAHKLLKKTKINPVELGPEDLWILEEGHCLRDQIFNLCSANSLNSNALSNIRFQSGSLETIIAIIKQSSGYTLLPHLATTRLKGAEKEQHLRPFSSPAPVREVSLVYSRVFYKEKYIEALESLIIKNTPSELRSPKKKTIVSIH